MGRKGRGWHLYDVKAHATLEHLIQQQQTSSSQPPATTATLTSGNYAYQIDLRTMTQCNQRTGKVRPIRRVLPGELFNASAPPAYTPPSPAVVVASSSVPTATAVPVVADHWPTTSTARTTRIPSSSQGSLPTTHHPSRATSSSRSSSRPAPVMDVSAAALVSTPAATTVLVPAHCLDSHNKGSRSKDPPGRVFSSKA